MQAQTKSFRNYLANKKEIKSKIVEGAVTVLVVGGIAAWALANVNSTQAEYARKTYDTLSNQGIAMKDVNKDGIDDIVTAAKGYGPVVYYGVKKGNSTVYLSVPELKKSLEVQAEIELINYQPR